MTKGNGNFIRKHNKDKNFTVIDNDIFKNKKLSLKSKGLLAMLLSLPEDWGFSESGLTALSSDGRSSLRSGLQELEDNGYLIRGLARTDKGTFTGTIYNVYEIPRLDLPLSDKPTSVNTHYKELSNKELTKSRTNVSKDIVPYSEIIDYLNDKTGKQFRDTSEKTIGLINTRIKEGFTVNDFKTVIDDRTNEWANDNKMNIYLRPETLFSNKFEGYLNNGKKLQTGYQHEDIEWDKL